MIIPSDKLASFYALSLATLCIQISPDDSEEIMRRSLHAGYQVFKGYSDSEISEFNLALKQLFGVNQSRKENEHES